MKRILLLVLLLCLPSKVYAWEMKNVGPSQQFIGLEGANIFPLENQWVAYVGTAPKETETLFYRQRVEMTWDDDSPPTNSYGLTVKLYGVYNFYWDGELIASNWAQGEKANQFSRVAIPLRGLTKGVHEIIMTIKSPGLAVGQNIGLHISASALNSSYFGVHSSVITTFFVATTSFVVACYLILLLITTRASATLVPGIILSFCIFSIILVQEGKHQLNYSYLWQPYLELARVPLGLLIIILLSWITFFRLKLKNTIALCILTLLTALLASEMWGAPFDKDTRALVVLMCILIGFSVVAKLKNKPSSNVFVVGYSFALFMLWFEPVSKHLFLIAITLFLAFDLGLYISNQSKKTINSILISQRLRADLLKKNLQPHFIMNSLSALMEWVEVAPELAVDFIDGLAGEFRILSNFSERSSVTVGEELELCNIHLSLMSKRYDGSFNIEATSLNKSALIPPGIFHTLIENAFSHNNYGRKKVTFKFIYENNNGVERYVLKTPCIGVTNHASGTGAGTHYIKARLEEFCGKEFSFNSQFINPNWITTIEMGRRDL